MNQVLVEKLRKTAYLLYREPSRFSGKEMIKTYKDMYCF